MRTAPNDGLTPQQRWELKNPDKVRERSRKQAEKQKRLRAKRRAQLPKCKICSDPLTRAGFARIAGFHQRCDAVAYNREYRVYLDGQKSKKK